MSNWKQEEGIPAWDQQKQPYEYRGHQNNPVNQHSYHEWEQRPKLRPSQSVDTLSWRTRSDPTSNNQIRIPAGWDSSSISPVVHGDWNPPSHILLAQASWNSPVNTNSQHPTKDRSPINMAPSDIWNPSLPQSSTSQQKPVQNWKSVNSSWRTNAQIPHNIGLEDKEVQRPSEPTEWIRRDSAQPKREIRRAQSSVLLSRPQNTSSHSNRNSFGQYTKPKSDNLYTPHKVGAVVEPHQNVNAPQFEKGNHFVSNLNTESSKFSIKNQEHKHRPSFPSTPNRFVTQQLKQGSRESLKATPLMKKKSKLLTEPIGIFIWGFGESVRVINLMSSFAIYGEIINVGFDVKNGIRYAFVDFETEVATKKAFSSIPNQFWFGMSTPLQVRYRFDKTSLPSFDAPIRRPSNDSSSSDLDYRTIHVSNLPHNINKPEIESVLSKIGHIHRIKIFQRAVEKKSSVFVTFKSTEKAKSARLFLETHKLPFKEMKESLEVEYPAQDISRNPPSFTLPGQTGGPLTLSKKARKLLAAENRIVYVRSLEPLDYATLKAGLEIIGPCEVYITKVDSPSTAFVEFATPGYCSTALAEKAMGATLPRHKRVDFPNDPNYTEVDLKEFLSSIADIKTVSEPTAEVTTVEFITALGAAKAIVHCRSVAFKGVKILADYTPSVKPEDGIDESVASQEGLDDKLCKDDKYDVDSETISLEVLEKPLKELDIGAPPLEEIIAMDVISLESLTHEIIESNGQDDMEDNGVISLSDLQSQI